jgi:hypothetical protein
MFTSIYILIGVAIILAILTLTGVLEEKDKNKEK